MSKFLKLAFISMMSVVLPNFSWAAEFAVELGFRQQSGETSATNYTTSSQNGIQGGFVGWLPIQENLFFRTGMLYTQRPLSIRMPSVTSGASDYTTSINYLDIPLTAMYKFEDYGGVFVGVNLSNQFDKSCSSPCNKIDGVVNPILPIVFGGTFKFAPQMGLTVYFESYGGDVAQELKNYKALGLNFNFSFE